MKMQNEQGEIPSTAYGQDCTRERIYSLGQTKPREFESGQPVMRMRLPHNIYILVMLSLWSIIILQGQQASLGLTP